MDKIYSFLDNASISIKMLKSEANPISEIIFSNIVFWHSSAYIKTLKFRDKAEKAYLAMS